MGVSGFLISCASRRATSRHAATFCDRMSGVTSSKTSTRPWPRRPSPGSGEATTARCRSRPSRSSATSCAGAASAGPMAARSTAASGARSLARQQIGGALPHRVRPQPQQPRGRGVDGGHGAVGVDRHDAGRDAFEDGLDVAPPPFGFLRLALEIDGRALQLAPAAGQFLGHAVERLDQRPELVFGLALDAVIQVARADLARRRGQHLHRARDALGQIEPHPRGADQDEQGHHQEERDVHAKQRRLEHAELPVVLVRRGHAPRSRRQFAGEVVAGHHRAGHLPAALRTAAAARINSPPDPSGSSRYGIAAAAPPRAPPGARRWRARGRGAGWARRRRAPGRRRARRRPR